MPEGLKSFSSELVWLVYFFEYALRLVKDEAFLFKRISRFALACFACTLSPVVQLSMILRGFPRSTPRFSRDLVIIAHLKAFVNSFFKTFFKFFLLLPVLFACSVSIPHYFSVVKRFFSFFHIILHFCQVARFCHRFVVLFLCRMITPSGILTETPRSADALYINVEICLFFSLQAAFLFASY